MSRSKTARRRSRSRRNSKQKNRPEKPSGTTSTNGNSRPVSSMDRTPSGSTSKKPLSWRRTRLSVEASRPRGTLGSALGSATPAPQRLTTYPTPPSEIKVTPEAHWAFARYMRYRQGAGGLPEAAYFCLTALESSVPAQARQKPKKATTTDAARWYGISSSVLSSTRRLSSVKGGPEARKADGIGKELHPGERIYLEKTTEAIIRRMAEKAHGVFIFSCLGGIVLDRQ